MEYPDREVTGMRVGDVGKRALKACGVHAPAVKMRFVQGIVERVFVTLFWSVIPVMAPDEGFLMSAIARTGLWT